MSADEVAARARELAETVLLPSAATVDAADAVPRSHLDALTAAGLYAPAARDLAVVEALASGCATTALVWIQHAGAVALFSGGGEGPQRLVPRLEAGEVRAGVALAGALAPDPLRVHRDGDGFVLDGLVPWVTGWGLVDVFAVAGRDPVTDDVHVLRLDPGPVPTVRFDPVRLVALGAARSGRLRFTGHRVPAEAWARTVPRAGWQARTGPGSARNGGLALGVAARAVAALAGTGTDVTGLAEQLDRARRLTRSVDRDRPDDPAAVASARAAASSVAVDAASALLVASGSRGIVSGSLPERLVREAAALLVFATRTPIRAALLQRWAGATRAQENR